MADVRVRKLERQILELTAELHRQAPAQPVRNYTFATLAVRPRCSIFSVARSSESAMPVVLVATDAPQLQRQTVRREIAG